MLSINHGQVNHNRLGLCYGRLCYVRKDGSMSGLKMMVIML